MTAQGQRCGIRNTIGNHYVIALMVVTLVVGLGAFMLVRAPTYAENRTSTPNDGIPREYVVVYYSRSDYSQAVAHEIAVDLNAHIAKISADYPLTSEGHRKAIADARNEAFPTIEVEPFELRSAKRVYLVSPTWISRPAPPLWTFVRNSNLSGKEVVLIMTGNSRIKPEEVDRFSQLIESRGGHFLYQASIRRSRFCWPMSRAEELDSGKNRMDEPDLQD